MAWARGGNLRTREGEGRDVAHVADEVSFEGFEESGEGGGGPNARCQYETNRARGGAWRVKREEGGETREGATGAVRVKRSALTGLESVRKGKAAEGVRGSRNILRRCW